MKYLFFLLSLLSISCNQSRNSAKTYANAYEKNIIDEMYCWSSYEAEIILSRIVYTEDEEEKDRLFDQVSELENKANESGREILKNDTICINLIRNDSLRRVLEKERKTLADNLFSFKKKVPFFSEFIDIITRNIVQYKYISSGDFGISEYPPVKSDDIIFRRQTFYKNYTELLKEYYQLAENAKFKEDHIVNLNKILVSLEKIDRKLWLVNSFFEAKKESEIKKLEKDRKAKVDSLLK